MKKPTRQTIVILLIAAVIFISAAAGIAVVLSKLYDLDARKADIISFLNKTLNREVSYEKGDFSLYFGPTFTFRGVEIKERNSQETFAKIERITFRMAVLPLLMGKIVFKEMRIEKPAGMLYRDRDGVFSISDLLEGQKEAPAIDIRKDHH